MLSIAAQLHIDVKGNPTSKGLCEKISSILDKGIPELDEVSDVVFDFLEAGGWIDEEGNVLEINLAKTKQDEEEESYEINEKEPDEPVVVEDKLPQCYGFEDGRDPSCKRCKVKDTCMILRVANRPKCFGKLYSEHEPECQVCIEMAACSEVMQKEG
jgi:hypothetical protein